LYYFQYGFKRKQREERAPLPSLCSAQTSIAESIPVRYLSKNFPGWRLHSLHRAVRSANSVSLLFGWVSPSDVPVAFQLLRDVQTASLN